MFHLKIHSALLIILPKLLKNYLLSTVVQRMLAKFPQWIVNHKFIPIQVFIMQIVGFENGILATTL